MSRQSADRHARSLVTAIARNFMGHWLYAAIPVAAAILGAIYTANVPPGPKLTGALQHFTAGLNFAAGSVELLPDLAHGNSIAPALIGGSIGIAVMMAVDRTTRGKGSAGLIAAASVDTLIDGLVLGLGFAAGQRQGFLLFIAVSMEALFLGLSIASAFDRRVGRFKTVGVTSGMALLLPVGLAIASPVGTLPQLVQEGFIAFGLIALLYLVTEGLLVEAHEHPETTWGTAMFFVAFLLILVLDDMMR